MPVEALQRFFAGGQLPLHLRALTVVEEVDRLLRVPPASRLQFVKFDDARNEVGSGRQARLFEEIVFVYRRIEETVVARKNIMCEVLPEETMEPLREERLKII